MLVGVAWMVVPSQYREGRVMYLDSIAVFRCQPSPREPWWSSLFSRFTQSLVHIWNQHLPPVRGSFVGIYSVYKISQLSGSPAPFFHLSHCGPESSQDRLLPVA